MAKVGVVVPQDGGQRGINAHRHAGQEGEVATAVHLFVPRHCKLTHNSSILGLG